MLQHKTWPVLVFRKKHGMHVVLQPDQQVSRLLRMEGASVAWKQEHPLLFVEIVVDSSRIMPLLFMWSTGYCLREDVVCCE